jgi:hypothetical protein
VAALAYLYDRKARQCGEDTPLKYQSITAAEEAAVRSASASRAQVRVTPSCGGAEEDPLCTIRELIKV